MTVSTQSLTDEVTMSCPSCGEVMNNTKAIHFWPIPGTIFLCTADDCEVSSVTISMVRQTEEGDKGRKD